MRDLSKRAGALHQKTGVVNLFSFQEALVTCSYSVTEVAPPRLKVSKSILKPINTIAKHIVARR